MIALEWVRIFTLPAAAALGAVVVGVVGLWDRHDRRVEERRRAAEAARFTSEPPSG